MSGDGQGTKWRRNIAVNFHRLSRVHERYRQTTDGRATAFIANVNTEREFTFAKNYKISLIPGLPCNFVSVMACLAILIEIRLVTNGKTDTGSHHASGAWRGKNVMQLF